MARPPASQPAPDKPSSKAASNTVSTIGDGVDIRLSSIPNAGNGLFAARAFARGDFITEVGKLVGMKVQVGFACRACI